MKFLTFSVFFLTAFFLFAEEKEVPSSAEEVPVPSFIKLDSVDLTKAPETYTVVEGDTLWDISAKFLDSPWYWPKVWSLNPQIENPNLIYPGDKVAFRGTGEIDISGKQNNEFDADSSTASEDVGETDPMAKSGRTLDDRPTNFKNYVQLGGKYRINRFKNIDDTLFDISKTGFIEKKSFKNFAKVVASQEPKELMSTEDSVYVQVGKQDLKVGDYVEFFEVGKTIIHPKTKKIIGKKIEIAGRGKIWDINSKGIATIKIIKSFSAIERGFLVKKFKKTDNDIKINEATSDIKATVVSGYDPTFYYGQTYKVYIDKGANQGVKVGDMLNVFRKGDGLGKADEKLLKKLPWEKLGEMVVIDVQKNTSVAIITKALVGIVKGDMAVSGEMN
jgi:hypothetical protein